MIILGIDPSLCCTGWGVLHYDSGEHHSECSSDHHSDHNNSDHHSEYGGVMTHIAHGVICPPAKIKAPTEQRLAFLAAQSNSLLTLYAPDIVCIEETFCGINPNTTLRLGFASGALLVTFGTANLPVFNYATRLVKRIITRNGAAKKEQVRDRIMEILQLENLDNLDSSDALAVAVAHVMTVQSQSAQVHDDVGQSLKTSRHKSKPKARSQRAKPQEQVCPPLEQACSPELVCEPQPQPIASKPRRARVTG